MCTIGECLFSYQTLQEGQSVCACMCVSACTSMSVFMHMAMFIRVRVYYGMCFGSSCCVGGLGIM